MPINDPFDTPSGGTLYGSAFVPITEAFGGNGIQSPGDAEISAAGASLDITVAAASDGIRVDDTSYTPASDTLTVSTPPTSSTNGTDDRRVDTVYFDTGTETYGIETGTPFPSPSPPEPPSGGFLLGFVEVEHDTNQIEDEDVLNYRAIAGVGYPVVTTDIADGAVTEDKLGNDVETTISVQDGGDVIDDEVTTINFGSGIDVTSPSPGTVRVEVDPSILESDSQAAQMLSRRANDPSAIRIEEALGVSARKAQVLSRRQ